MSKFKVGDKVRVVKKECGHEFGIGEIVVVDSVNDEFNELTCIKSEDYWFLHFDEVEKVNGYFESNRYKLHKAASETGFSFSKLSRAMGRSDTYISNESKESRFNERGDISETRLNKLLTDLRYAELEVLGMGPKTVEEPSDAEIQMLDLASSVKEKPKSNKPLFIGATVVISIVLILFILNNYLQVV